MIKAKPYRFILNKQGFESVQISVCISLFNYEKYIVDALESIYKQTLGGIDLILVDDCSQDHSVSVAKKWLEQRQQRFNSIRLIKHVDNQGLAASRNTGISVVETPFIFILDADNLLYPRCLERCLSAIEASDAAFAYPILERFGSHRGIMGNLVWNSTRLSQKNYIDAMSLLRKSVIYEVGGYSRMQITGWEDYDLWCKFLEMGYWGVLVPEILAKYRVHASSMLHTTTNENKNQELLVKDMMERHPWLKL